MSRAGDRMGRLLVSVRALSGRTYPAGTLVRLVGRGPAVDGWLGGEWVPLRWWEFAEAPAGVLPAHEAPAGLGRRPARDVWR